MVATTDLVECPTDDVAGKIESWNPMEEAFTNPNFNRYELGPGANLDDEFQPANMATDKEANDKIRKAPYLCLRRVPQEMTKRSIRNLFSKYGKVTGIRQSRSNLWFIDFESFNDMERAFNALENNIFGIVVQVGKKEEADPKVKSGAELESSSTSRIQNLPELEYESRMDLSSRCIPGPFTTPKRPPLLHSIPFITSVDHENSDLQLLDPQKHFLISHDMHALSRLKHIKHEIKGEMNVHTGRAYFVESDDQLKFIETKCAASDGSFCSKTNTFVVKSKSNFLDKFKTYKCVVCKSLTHLSCKKCSKYYCSNECIHSPRHECAKLMGLSRKHSHSDENKTVDILILPPTNSIVTITSILRTNLVFVKSKVNHDHESYWKVLNALNREFYNCKPLAELPQVGQIVGSNFLNTNQLNRAYVLKVVDTKHIYIAYIDFGNVEIKPLTELYMAPSICYEKPRYAFPIILKGIDDFKPNEEVDNFLSYCLKQGTFKLQYEYNTDGSIIGELFELETNENINTTIQKLRHVPRPSRDEIVYVQDISLSHIEEMSTLDIFIYDNSAVEQTYFLSFICEKDVIPLQELNTELNLHAEHYKSALNYAPRENEMCLVKYIDDKWYRGKCLEVVGDGHPTIQFVDYGNITPVHISKIRRYPKEFTHPVATFDCEIHGLPEMVNDNVGKRLKELLPIGLKLNAHILKRNIEENYYVLKLDEVIQTLKLEKLIT